MSNQVYYESYTCSCVRKHPKEEVFVAQSAANYIAIFQSTKPYRMNRRKVCFVIPYPLPALRKSQSERVQDRNVLFARRRIACHGSAGGSLYFYDYQTSRVMNVIRAFHKSACTCAEYHPLRSSTVAISSWDGKIAILQSPSCSNKQTKV